MTDGFRPPRFASRRGLVAGAGIAALGIVAGCTGVASAPPRGAPIDDAALLNNVLGLEYEVAAAYDAVLAAGAIVGTVAALVHAFETDHAKHAEALVRAILRLQEKPVAARAPQDYRFSPAAFSEREDALRFLLGFEQGLALAHLAAVPAFADRNLAKGAAGILGVETMHWSALRSALGEDPVPGPFLG
jgi:hypothetical protein